MKRILTLGGIAVLAIAFALLVGNWPNCRMGRQADSLRGRRAKVLIKSCSKVSQPIESSFSLRRLLASGLYW